jgi:hypothetical protein
MIDVPHHVRLVRHLLPALILVAIVQASGFGAEALETQQARGFFADVYRVIAGPVSYLIVAIGIGVSLYGFLFGAMKWAFIGIGGIIFIACVKALIDIGTSGYSGGTFMPLLGPYEFPFFGRRTDASTDSLYVNHSWAADWYVVIESFARLGCKMCEEIIRVGFSSMIVPGWMLISGLWAYRQFAIGGNLSAVYNYFITTILVFSLCVYPCVQFAPPVNMTQNDIVQEATGFPNSGGTIPIAPALFFAGSYHLSHLMVSSLIGSSSDKSKLYQASKQAQLPTTGDVQRFQEYCMACNGAVLTQQRTSDAWIALSDSPRSSKREAARYYSNAPFYQDQGPQIPGLYSKRWSDVLNNETGLRNVSYLSGSMESYLFNLDFGTYVRSDANRYASVAFDGALLAASAPLAAEAGTGALLVQGGRMAMSLGGRAATTAITNPGKTAVAGALTYYATSEDAGSVPRSTGEFQATSMFRAGRTYQAGFLDSGSTAMVYSDIEGALARNPGVLQYLVNRDNRDNSMNFIAIGGARHGTFTDLAAWVTDPTGARPGGYGFTVCASRDTGSIQFPLATRDSNTPIIGPASVAGIGAAIYPMMYSTSGSYFDSNVTNAWTLNSGTAFWGFNDTLKKSIMLRLTRDETAQWPVTETQFWPIDYGSFVRSKALEPYLQYSAPPANLTGVTNYNDVCFQADKNRPNSPNLWGCLVVGEYSRADGGYSTEVRRLQEVFDQDIAPRIAGRLNSSGWDRAWDRDFYLSAYDVLTAAPGISAGQLNLMSPAPTAGSASKSLSQGGAVAVPTADTGTNWLTSALNWLAGATFWLISLIAGWMAELIEGIFKYIIGIVVMLILLCSGIFGMAGLVPALRSAVIGLAQAALWISLWPVGIAIGFFFINNAGNLAMDAATTAEGGTKMEQVLRFVGSGLVLMSPLLASAILSLSSAGLQKLGGSVLSVGMATVGSMAQIISTGLGAMVVGGATMAAARVGMERATKAVGEGADMVSGAGKKIGDMTTSAQEAIAKQTYRYGRFGGDMARSVTSTAGEVLAAATKPLQDPIGSGAGAGMGRGAAMGADSANGLLQNTDVVSLGNQRGREATMAARGHLSDHRKLASLETSRAEQAGAQAQALFREADLTADPAKRAALTRDAGMRSAAAAGASAKAVRYLQSMGRNVEAGKAAVDAAKHAEFARSAGIMTQAEHHAYATLADSSLRDAMSAAVRSGNQPAIKAIAMAQTRLLSDRAQFERQLAESYESQAVTAGNAAFTAAGMDARAGFRNGMLTIDSPLIDQARRLAESAKMDADLDVERFRKGEISAEQLTKSGDRAVQAQARAQSVYRNLQEVLENDPNFLATSHQRKTALANAAEFDRDYGEASKAVQDRIVADLGSLTPQAVLGGSAALDSLILTGADAARVGAGSGQNASEVRRRMAEIVSQKTAEMRRFAQTKDLPASDQHRLEFAADMLDAFQGEVSSQFDGSGAGEGLIRETVARHVSVPAQQQPDHVSVGLAKKIRANLADLKSPAAKPGEVAAWSALTDIDNAVNGFEDYARALRSPVAVPVKRDAVEADVRTTVTAER